VGQRGQPVALEAGGAVDQQRRADLDGDTPVFFQGRDHMALRPMKGCALHCPPLSCRCSSLEKPNRWLLRGLWPIAPLPPQGGRLALLTRSANRRSSNKGS